MNNKQSKLIAVRMPVELNEKLDQIARGSRQSKAKLLEIALCVLVSMVERRDRNVFLPYSDQFSANLIDEIKSMIDKNEG